MCAESYEQSESTSFVLMFINNIFVVIFAFECLMKLFSLYWRFFIIPWNVFDMIIVLLSLFAALFENYVKNFLTFSPTVLRVVRVVRVGRVLRLIKGARGIRTLLFALAISLPALVNIGLLLFLIIFIYVIFRFINFNIFSQYYLLFINKAIFGMNFFMYVKYAAGINELFNFENIYRSMITLFPMCTSAGWSNVLEALTNDQPPYCDDTM